MTSQVFWPEGWERRCSGYIIGWNICSFVCSVLAVAPPSLSLSDIEELIESRLLTGDERLGRRELLDYARGPPIVLGYWRCSGADCTPADRLSEAQRRKYKANFWLSMKPASGCLAIDDRTVGQQVDDDSHGDAASCCSAHTCPAVDAARRVVAPPVVSGIHSFGHLFDTCSTVIFYRQTAPLFYLATTALSLDVAAYPPPIEPAQRSFDAPHCANPLPPPAHPTALSPPTLPRSSSFSSFTSTPFTPSKKPSHLSNLSSSSSNLSSSSSNLSSSSSNLSSSSSSSSSSSNLSSSSQRITTTVQSSLDTSSAALLCPHSAATTSHAGAPLKTRGRSLSQDAGMTVAEQASSVSELEQALRQANCSATLAGCLLPASCSGAPVLSRGDRLAVRLFAAGESLVALYMTLVTALLLFREQLDALLRVGGVSHVSAFSRDAHERLVQLAQWPHMSRHLRRQWADKHRQRAYAVQLINSALLAVLDSAAGLLVSLLIFSGYASDCSGQLVALFDGFNGRLVDPLVRWLMGWPAGFKLNDSLDIFLGKASLSVTAFWTACFQLFAPYWANAVVYLLAAIGPFGVSTQLMLFVDVVALCTLHVRSLFALARDITRRLGAGLVALFLLFRGKKQNVLRNRVDTCHYNINQFLLGIITFTVLFFLFPTVASYFLCFGLLRLLVVAVQLLLIAAVEFIRSVPLFPLIIAALCPTALPRGVSFDVLATHWADAADDSHARPLYLRVQSEPLPTATIVWTFAKPLIQLTRRVWRRSDTSAI